MQLQDFIEQFRKEGSCFSVNHSTVEFVPIIVKLEDEIERLKRGDFTEEEFQNLCHKFQETDRQRFCNGCEVYQQKLFGSSPITELRQKLAELEREVEQIHEDAAGEDL